MQDHGEYMGHRGHCPLPRPEGHQEQQCTFPAPSQPVPTLLGTATCLKLSMKVGGNKAALDMKKKKI